MKGHGSGSVTRYTTSPLSVAFNTALYFDLSATRLISFQVQTFQEGSWGTTFPAMLSKTLVHKWLLAMTQTFQTDAIKILMDWWIWWFDGSWSQQGKFRGGKDEKPKWCSKDSIYLIFSFTWSSQECTAKASLLSIKDFFGICFCHKP